MKLWLILLFGFFITGLCAQSQEENQQAIKILQNSKTYLDCNTCWNQEDDRSCIDDNTNKKYSLYCALHESQLAIAGEYKHRGLVMKTIRKVIRSQTTKCYPHIIRDYNNLPTTTMDDIYKIIDTAIEIIGGTKSSE
jgi:hypothetical protein